MTKAEEPVSLVILDPYHPAIGVLTPIAARRIFDMATSHTQEIDATQQVKAIMTRLWAQDPTVAVVLMVDKNGVVVGHAVASIESDGVNSWVFISQTKADVAVGDAVDRCLALAESWAQEYNRVRLIPAGRRPVTHLLMASHRSDLAWQRRMNFETVRHVMARQIEPKGREGREGLEDSR